MKSIPYDALNDVARLAGDTNRCAYLAGTADGLYGRLPPEPDGYPNAAYQLAYMLGWLGAKKIADMAEGVPAGRVVTSDL